MGNSDKLILVAGATGRQGSAVVRHLRPKGWRLRALTRNPGSPAAQDLARQGIEIVQGDLEEPESLERATEGVYGVYSVQDFWAVGAKREVMQGRNLADAAKKAAVQHFVYSSVGGAERHSGIDHWESKWEIEQHIRNIGLPATVLRPARCSDGSTTQGSGPTSPGCVGTTPTPLSRPWRNGCAMRAGTSVSVV